ncbi:protein NRT1/ PTR FAMILY 5.6-like [Aristolochia californica]|uniref:protein NRT1/ PTR FAMILY 5.6-like n=1 Tax=Aristolochia californica TaxID=171875 RepID=UPI0035D8E458
MEVELERKLGGSTRVANEQWVYDSSVDHKGRVPLRSSTGVWKASFFTLALEFSERLSYFGIITNLINYLTQVLNQDVKTAAKNVNYWFGVALTVPLIGGFLADAYWGRFKTVVIASVMYLLGFCLLTMSQFVPSLKPCETDACDKPRPAHEIVFFVSMYIISVATGAHKTSLESFGADQFDENHIEERKKKMSFFNWWNSAISFGFLLAVTFLVYIQDYVSWGVSDIIILSIMTVSLGIFLCGIPHYRYSVPRGSPLTPLAQVLVAAFAKRNLPYPASPDQLYELSESERGNLRILCHTNNLRFLDKAAIIEGQDVQAIEKKNTWRLATVTQVEEIKLVLNVIPIWLGALLFGVVNAQGTSFFIKQGSSMNRKLTHNFTMPTASMYSFSAVAIMVTIAVYEKVVIPRLRRIKNNERGLTILQRVGIGLGVSILVMISAAVVERKRLNSIDTKQPSGGPSISVFWLTPQFIFLGIGDAFALVGLQEFFYDQVPDSMRSLGMALYLSVIGVASFLTNLLITIIDRVTEKFSSNSWFSRDLNKSRLDHFYWFLAVLSGMNLCAYVVLAKRYSYKSVQNIEEIEEEGIISG